MGGATEMLEHMEHAGHAGHGEGGGHGGPGRGIGITMAILGVLLALTAAMVGSERTELTKTMVEQSNTFNEFQATSMKYRVMMSELQMLHALTPSKEEVKAFEAELAKIHKPEAAPKPGAEPAKPDATADVMKQLAAGNAELVESIKLSTRGLADILSPDATDEVHFLTMIQKYKRERKEAKEWAEAYEGAINAHFNGSELYEKAQLASEIGIVIASIALLLGSRPFWYVSIVAGLACAAVIGYTFFTSHKTLAAAEEKIEEEKKTYEEEKKRSNSQKDDDLLVSEVRALAKEHNVPLPPEDAEEPAHGGHGAPGGSAATEHGAAKPHEEQKAPEHH